MIREIALNWINIEKIQNINFDHSQIQTIARQGRNHIERFHHHINVDDLQHQVLDFTNQVRSLRTRHTS